ncbi:Basic leucine zipper 43 [Rhynchospora pubera]|uniref:Basic leucine zipper 43 n=1 Tax=Rhynchospora pubera TaxID=906938 RepID=A0AAV8CWE5_9POAL|nr:Basic leucine zipper 43 [Rhynchospora pubera]
MQAFDRTIPINTSVLEQESNFTFGSAPNSNDTSLETTEQENTLTVEDSRRLRRMKSNRESARRSRMRKRIHLEELGIQLDQLQAQNHDLRTQLRSVLSRSSLVRQENKRLQIEALLFKKRLDEAQTLLIINRLHRVNNVPQNFQAFRRGQVSALASLIV